MRTRSQPDSPGGLVSLEDMQSTTRRTRSTRSASRAASQEPSSQQSAEPATQAPTRSKSQQRTTKKTTTKKATTAKTASTKSTSKASSAKPQTRTSSRRGTRSATRKAGRDASEEVHESIEQNNHDTARPEDDNNTELNTEKAVTGASKSDAALMEHKATEQLSDDIARALEDAELVAERQRREDSIEKAAPATPKADHRATDNPAAPETSEQVDAAEPTSEEADEVEQLVPAVSDKHDTRQETVSPSASPVHSDKKAVVEDTSVDKLVELFAKLSLSKSVRFTSPEATVFPMESTTVPTELPETRPASVISTVSAAGLAEVNLALVLGDSLFTRVTALIFTDVNPPMPALNLFAAPRPVQRTTLFATPFPISSTSIFENGQRPPRYDITDRARSVEAPLVPVVLEEEPELTPGPPLRQTASRVRSGHQWLALNGRRQETRPPLSPIPEENDLDPACSMNRKRPRAESPVEENAEPATPNVNKRRNTGPAGSTPFALRHTSLTRRLARIAPRDQRLARRAAESQGRIHSTIFRLPAFVAQAEADRRASEAAALTAPPHSEPLNTELPLSYQQDQADEQVADEEPVAAPETSTPQTPRRGWNITGIFNSVPRSFSRFFSRSPARSEAPAIQQPATEYIRRTRPLDEAFPPADSEEASNRGRRLSEQPPAKRPRNLSYSLFPPKIDRSLYLPPEDTTTPAKTPAEAPAEASAPADSTAHQPVQDMPQRTQSQTPSETTERGISHASSIGGQPQKKKRKRSPSPDVIPNPPGCSYGLHPDYFYYSSDESDEEEEEIPAPQTEPRNTLSRTALRSAVQTERPASKKVRFDASPDDTPSKLRARDLPRATDPYTGRHFIGMGSPQPASAPTTPTPERQLTPDEAHAQMRARPGFRPNLSGTFQLDYDAFSDDSDSSGSESPTSIPAPSPLTSTITPSASESAQSSTPRSTAPSTQSTQPIQTPSAPAKVDEEALARARSQAEKYKPKTPSGLRTASRYSSPLTAVTPATPELTPAPVKSTADRFGDDQFAEDAQWLYDICPSGDLRQLVWPETKPFNEGLNVGSESLRIANDIWDSAEANNAHNIFQREFAEFAQTLA